MRILFTICGRAGSKSLRNKNLIDFLGYPLPFYTVSAIDLFMKQSSGVQSDIVLNTDSKNLIMIFKKLLRIKFNVIERDPLLGLDYTPKISVILNSFRIMRKRKKINYNMIVDLDITSPLRTVDDIQNLIYKKIHSDADVVFSVTEARRNPFYNMVKKTINGGYVRVIESTYNARQETPEVFDMNASLYAYSPEFLEKEKGIFEGKCDVIKMVDTAVLDLDHENDFELMQVIAKYLFIKNNDMGKIRDNIEKIMK